MSKEDKRSAVLAIYRELTTRDENGVVRAPSFEEVLVRLGMSPNSKGWLSLLMKQLIAEGAVVRTRGTTGISGGRDYVVVDLEDRRLDALADVAMKVACESDGELRANFRQAFAATLARVG